MSPPFEIPRARGPIRFKLSRKKGWRMPPGAMKCDRSTPYGNPFNATQSYIVFVEQGFPAPMVKLREPPSLGRCLDLFAAYLAARLAVDPAFLDPLRGRDLGCWCELTEPCHVDIILQLANRGS